MSKRNKPKQPKPAPAAEPAPSYAHLRGFIPWPPMGEPMSPECIAATRAALNIPAFCQALNEYQAKHKDGAA